MLTKTRSPSTNEVVYRYTAIPREPLPQSPELHLGGRIDVDGLLEVYADRIAVSFRWCHSSGHAELYFEGEGETVRRNADGWPPETRSTVERRFGEEVATEVTRILADPDAFR